MNIRQLTCFQSVMSLGTATEAAAALGISQPAVSLALTGLERELGFRLFERSNGRLVPTREAQFFVQDVGSAVLAINRASQTARAIRNSTYGNLVIACYPGIALEFLPRLLTGFLATRPGVRIELQSRDSSVIHELTSTQSFDVGIADLPLNRRDVSTTAITLECVCVVPKKHPLAKRSVIRAADLDGIPFFSLFKEHQLYYQVANAFAAANVHWNVVAECRFFSSACAFVANGYGATIIDPITASDFSNRGVAVKPFKPRIAYDIGLILPLRRPQSALTKSLVVDITRELKRYAAPGT